MTETADNGEVVPPTTEPPTTEPPTTEPPTTTPPTTPTVEPTLYGDANNDGVVTIADAAAVLQHLGNNDKYALSEQGVANADVDGQEGLTAADAIDIQKFDAKLIDKFAVMS
jgi:heme-binding NEAT domain protein